MDFKQDEAHIRILQETIRTLKAEAQRERERFAEEVERLVQQRELLRPLLERCLVSISRVPDRFQADRDNWTGWEWANLEQTILGRQELCDAIRAELKSSAR
jgi:hypothetical protein